MVRRVVKMVGLICFLWGGHASATFWKHLPPSLWWDWEFWKNRQERAMKGEGFRGDFTDLKEGVGQVIHCRGTCFHYRGHQFSKAKALALIREGDEIKTQKDSYCWIFLWDGSLVRMSSQTWVTVREFNVAKEGFFVFLRLNEGHIFLSNRKPQLLVEDKAAQTDSLFHPLPFEVEGGLMWGGASLEKINQAISLNLAQFPHRPTHTLINMGHGVLYGRGFSMEIFRQVGGGGFFQQKSSLWHSSSPQFGVEFWPHRGDSESVQAGKVYRTHPSQGQLEVVSDDFFARSGLLLKRVPSVIMVRERWLAKYARNLHHPRLGHVGLGEEVVQGPFRTTFRLWGGWGKGEEMDRRTSFLRLHLPYVESLYSRENKQVISLVKQQDLPGELPLKYYSRALRHYLHRLD